MEFINQLTAYLINCANLSIDPDQMQHNMVSDQCLHCLSLLDILTGSNMDLLKFYPMRLVSQT